ncbi:putative ATP-dependent endonuclease of OLD family [Desulfitobacterium sp. LBE]|uniref:ATP-dependent nuclease n=1 Tax=Desulfitobacterium sp. LBE TaxID=884086 RepID=UPI00119AEB2F|nr:AAA family ATPase [Desulfitobacterium sp. LBE]TWH59615.1 putative ATP-dependent endonuclease of OLD family [Desulfitobacterium sp. LBE]
MKISKLKICRFRCFGDEEETIQFDELTSLIGNNSSGKTAALQALLKLFSDNSGDRSFQRSDFYLPKGVKPDELKEQNLYIEAVFNFPELKTEGEEGKYVVPVYFEHFVVEEPGGAPYLRVRVEASWEKGNNAEGSIENKIYYILCAEDEEIKEENKRSTNRHDLDKIRMVYVPAVRDPSKQLRNVSGTMMYRIMESINWSEEIKTSVETKVGELNEAFIQESGVSILKNAIHTQWKNYDADYRYTNAEMRFNNTDMDSILKKSEVVFSPSVTGRKYGIDDMGDGLRSLFYISMVDSMLEVENEIRKEVAEGKEKRSFNTTPPVLTIVAVEEPENHISPHLVGKLINKFKNISKRENAQTIIATHSPAIVKRIDPENIRYLRMSIDDLSTKVKTISFPSKEKHEDKYKYVKEAVQAYPELYFAKLVVLGEGDSEEILIPKLLELCGRNIDSSGISVVPLGGRHVNHFWRLLNDLEIPFVTLLDLDTERVGGGWGRVKYVLSQLLEIGVPRKDLLKVENGILSKDEFEKMHTWDLEKDNKILKGWVNYLEYYNVFFSSPLDLDFMMLENFGDCYKDILEESEGPYIQGKKKGENKISYIEVNDPLDKDYIARVLNDVHCTLKENGGDGFTYSDAQKRLMVWYNYFFLNRGKPSTHILALSKINDANLKDNAPDVLKRMISKIEEFLVTAE